MTPHPEVDLHTPPPAKSHRHAHPDCSGSNLQLPAAVLKTGKEQVLKEPLEHHHSLDHPLPTVCDLPS